MVEVEITGPGTEDNHFAVNISRKNPASSGNVTGKQTYVSFLSSIKGNCNFEITSKSSGCWVFIGMTKQAIGLCIC